MGVFLVAGDAHQDEGRSAFTSKSQLPFKLPEPLGGRGGWSQRKRAAPGRETCSGLLFSSVAFVRMAVTFS